MFKVDIAIMEQSFPESFIEIRSSYHVFWKIDHFKPFLAKNGLKLLKLSKMFKIDIAIMEQ